MMSKESMFVQCVVEQHQGDARMERVFWAPEEKAVPGRAVKVEEDDGSWTAGWTVKSVHGPAMPEKLVRHRSHDHTRTRKASDI